MKLRTTFRTASELYHADTCEPLKAASACGDLRLEALGRGSYPGTRLPKNDLQEILMAGYWNASFDQDWGLDWHCNEGLEIGHLAAGSLPFRVDKKIYQLKPGDLTITRPWQRHRVGDPHVPANHYSWLILDVGMRRPNQPWHWPDWLLLPQTSLQRLTDLLRQNEQPVWHGNREIGRCFERIDETVALGNGVANQTRLKILINELVVLLAELLEFRNRGSMKPWPAASARCPCFSKTCIAGSTNPGRSPRWRKRAASAARISRITAGNSSTSHRWNTSRAAAWKPLRNYC